MGSGSSSLDVDLTRAQSRQSSSFFPASQQPLAPQPVYPKPRFSSTTMSSALNKSLPNLRLHLHPRPFQLVRLPLSHPIPTALLSSPEHSYVSVTRTKDEISVILDTELEGAELRKLFGLPGAVGDERAEAGVELEGPWRTFQVEGPMVLSEYMTTLPSWSRPSADPTTSRQRG